jgi:anti-anti-sigma regulatory factor
MGALEPTTIVCDIAVLDPDAASIGVLARLQLCARRAGVDVQLRGGSDELRDLIAFVGLDEVLRVEPGGQPEEREELVGVEEEGELPDAPA